MYCPNCGCLTLDKECEWCGPSEYYKKSPNYCKDCGRPKKQEISPCQDEPIPKDDLCKTPTHVLQSTVEAALIGLTLLTSCASTPMQWIGPMTQ